MTTPLKPRLPRGFEDANGPGLDLQNRIITILSEVYARYGFDRLTTPAIEFADALGKFLPDQDRPNEGVFSFRDEDGDCLGDVARLDTCPHRPMPHHLAARALATPTILC